MMSLVMKVVRQRYDLLFVTVDNLIIHSKRIVTQ